MSADVERVAAVLAAHRLSHRRPAQPGPGIAADERDVAAAALREAADEWRDGDGYRVAFDGSMSPQNFHDWLRARADRLTATGDQP